MHTQVFGLEHYHTTGRTRAVSQQGTALDECPVSRRPGDSVSCWHLGQQHMTVISSKDERREAEPGQSVYGSHEFSQNATHVFAGLVQIHGFAIAIQFLGTHDE